MSIVLDIILILTACFIILWTFLGFLIYVASGYDEAINSGPNSVILTFLCGPAAWFIYVLSWTLICLAAVVCYIRGFFTKE